MRTNCAIYLAHFYLFSYEFDFLKCLFKNNACHAVLHRLYLVCRIVDDLFVADFPNFENFMYLDQDSFHGGIYPKISCELKYTSKSFSRNFLDLAMKQRYILWYLSQMLSTRVCNCWNDFHALSIPISQLLLSWELSTVKFTGFRGFVVLCLSDGQSYRSPEKWRLPCKDSVKED